MPLVYKRVGFEFSSLDAQGCSLSLAVKFAISPGHSGITSAQHLHTHVASHRFCLDANDRAVLLGLEITDFEVCLTAYEAAIFF
jgi:hypothetical protein